MPAHGDISSGWKTYEIALKGTDGKTVTPFFDQLRVGGKPDSRPISKMRMIEQLGWLEAKRILKYEGKKVIVKKDDVIWLVKCRPTCWRLYCYVYENGEKHYIIYVYAVCKKTDDEAPSSLPAARKLAEAIKSGTAGIQEFKFPAG